MIGLKDHDGFIIPYLSAIRNGTVNLPQCSMDIMNCDMLVFLALVERAQLSSMLCYTRMINSSVVP